MNYVEDKGPAKGFHDMPEAPSTAEAIKSREYAKARVIAELRKGDTAIWIGRLPSGEYWKQRECGDAKSGSVISALDAASFCQLRGLPFDIPFAGSAAYEVERLRAENASLRARVAELEGKAEPHDSGPLTEERLRAEALAMFNDVVLVADCELGRLTGAAVDDDDFYYIVKKFDHGAGNVVYVSACIAVVSLKGAYRRYDRADWVLAHNGCKPEAEFKWDDSRGSPAVLDRSESAVDDGHTTVLPPRGEDFLVGYKRQVAKWQALRTPRARTPAETES